MKNKIKYIYDILYNKKSTNKCFICNKKINIDKQVIRYETINGKIYYMDIPCFVFYSLLIWKTKAKKIEDIIKCRNMIRRNR